MFSATPGNFVCAFKETLAHAIRSAHHCSMFQLHTYLRPLPKFQHPPRERVSNHTFAATVSSRSQGDVFQLNGATCTTETSVLAQKESCARVVVQCVFSATSSDFVCTLQYLQSVVPTNYVCFNFTLTPYSSIQRTPRRQEPDQLFKSWLIRPLTLIFSTQRPSLVGNTPSFTDLPPL